MSKALTNYDKLIIESGGELSPAKLNESLDKRLTFVTTNLTLVATIATGFGLFTSLAGPLREESGYLQVILGLLLSSVVLVVIANFPNWWQKVNPNDIQSIEAYYKNRYVWRSWVARIAILAFAVAVVLAAFTVWNVVGTQPEPLTSVRFSAGEKPTVSATVSAGALDPGQEIETRLRGCVEPVSDQGCTEGVLLAVDSSRADSNGDAEITLSVSPTPENISVFTLHVATGRFVDQRTIVRE